VRLQPVQPGDQTPCGGQAHGWDAEERAAGGADGLRVVEMTAWPVMIRPSTPRASQERSMAPRLPGLRAVENHRQEGVALGDARQVIRRDGDQGDQLGGVFALAEFLHQGEGELVMPLHGGMGDDPFGPIGEALFMAESQGVDRPVVA